MISVIIPVYNAEKYIRRCVDSVLRQSFSELEVILVNDGSKDRSGEIIRELAAQDCRIVAVEQENAGASSARNTGIDAATGDYIAFVDSDDLIPENYIADLYAGYEDGGCDLSICGYTDVYSDRSVVHVLDKETAAGLTGQFGEDMCRVRQFIYSPCMKMYKKAIIDENGIRFDGALVTAEDQQFNFRYYEHVNTYSFVNKGSYQYYREGSGLSMKKTLSCYKSDKAVAEYIAQYLDRHEVPGRELMMAEKLVYITFRYLLLTDAPNDYPSAKKRLTDIEVEWRPARLPNRFHNIVYAMLRRGIIYPLYVSLKAARKRKAK